MARLSYADPRASRAAAPDLVSRIVAERGEVLHLYAMLLQSPPIAQGWLELLTAVRQRGALEGSLRELVIMRVAHLNKAPYEAEQHRPIALKEGLSDSQVDALNAWEASDLFDERQRAALRYCDAMTLRVHVDDAIFADVRREFSDRETVELTVTVAAYNMVSRVLEALDIRSGDDRGDWA